MSRVIVDVSPSLDGYLAGREVSVGRPFGDTGHRLHRWLGLDGAVPTDADTQASEATFAGAGAVVLGRRMFDVGIGTWGEDGAFGLPCFVATTRARRMLHRGPTTFTFVTDGVRRAVELAREAAGERNVVIAGGADVVRQCLSDGLVDELRLHVVPVLLGAGTPLFDSLPRAVELEPTGVVATRNAIHSTLRVVRERRLR